MKKYSVFTVPNKDNKTQTWMKDPKKQMGGHVEYLYLIVRDKTGQYPNGRVLLGEHAPNDENVCHDKILTQNKMIQDYYVKSDTERQKKIDEGFTILDSADIIEAGAIRYDYNGNRYDQSRTRFFDEMNGHQRRKDIKMVYARIKKHMAKIVHGRTAYMDTKRGADETIALTYAPTETDPAKRITYIVPQDKSTPDFIKENCLAADRIFSVARIGKDASGVLEVRDITTFEPYQSFAAEDHEMMLRAVQARQMKNALHLATRQMAR